MSVQYNKLILCSHYPIEAFKGLKLFKLSNSRSYMVASKTSETMQGQYLSVDFPSRSIRTATINQENYLVLGGRIISLARPFILSHIMRPFPMK